MRRLRLLVPVTAVIPGTQPAPAPLDTAGTTRAPGRERRLQRDHHRVAFPRPDLRATAAGAPQQLAAGPRAGLDAIA